MNKKIAFLLILIFVGNMCLYAAYEDEIGIGIAGLLSGETGFIIGGALILILVLIVTILPAITEAELPADMPRIASAGESLIQHTSFGFSPQSKEVFIGFTFHPGEKKNAQAVNQFTQFGESSYTLPGTR